MYKHINAVHDAITSLPPMGFDLLIGKSQNDLVELAENDIGYRYALKQLNPFAITGNDSLYTQHNGSGELDLYDPDTGIGMTEDYLGDRARFLALKIRLGIADDDVESFSREGDSAFKDLKGDLTLNTNRSLIQGLSTKNKIIFDDARSQPVNGGSEGDRLYGGDGVDFVYGYDGEDYIEGNVDGDHLIGGAGSDTLLGGEGNDTLYGGDQNVVVNVAGRSLGGDSVVAKAVESDFLNLATSHLETRTGSQNAAIRGQK